MAFESPSGYMPYRPPQDEKPLQAPSASHTNETTLKNLPHQVVHQYIVPEKQTGTAAYNPRGPHANYDPAAYGHRLSVDSGEPSYQPAMYGHRSSIGSDISPAPPPYTPGASQPPGYFSEKPFQPPQAVPIAPQQFKPPKTNLPPPPPIVEPSPARPTLPHNQYSQPYVAPAPQLPGQQPQTLATGPFQHPYQPAQLPTTPQAGLTPPVLSPPRPSSAPPESYPAWEQHIAGQPDVAVIAQPQPAPYIAPLPVNAYTSLEHGDDRQTNAVSRFVGNMLVVRTARAGITSAMSTVKLPLYLSPWGDNNPMTLPNVRKRDIALAGVAHFGIDALADSAVTLVEHTVQYAATFTAEQAAHQGIDAARPNRQTGPTPKLTPAGLLSASIRIKHKLLGEDASLTFLRPRDTSDKTSCAKGWFLPYLYASGRTAALPRARDFSVAQLHGPGLAADASLAPTLLAALQASAPSAPLAAVCPSAASAPFPRFRRCAVFLAGISPCRTASCWSQARIPGQARLNFHLCTQLPVLILPVAPACPVAAWSAWTVRQMRTREGGFDPTNLYYEIFEFLDAVVDEDMVDAAEKGMWRHTLGKALWRLIEGAAAPAGAVGGAEFAGACETERAGIVMFRF